MIATMIMVDPTSNIAMTIVTFIAIFTVIIITMDTLVGSLVGN